MLLYHGSKDSKLINSFTIPHNIFLVIGNCCGTSNFGLARDYYKGLQLDETSPNIIGKKEIIDQIKTGKITISGSEYVTLKPNSDM